MQDGAGQGGAELHELSIALSACLGVYVHVHACPPRRCLRGGYGRLSLFSPPPLPPSVGCLSGSHSFPFPLFPPQLAVYRVLTLFPSPSSPFSWLSIGFLSFAQLGLYHPGSQEQEGWAWAGFGDAVEAMGLDTFVRVSGVGLDTFVRVSGMGLDTFVRVSGGNGARHLCAGEWRPWGSTLLCG